MAVFLAFKLAKTFRGPIASSSFLALWRTAANITPISKGNSPFQFPLEYRPISITLVISKFDEKLISRRLYKLLIP